MKTCKIEGCQTKHHSLGYCQKHYYRFKAHGDPNIVKTKRRGLCSVPNCGLPHSAKGYCWKHYMRLKYKAEGGRPCKFPGCKRTHYAKGYCRKHHAILLRKGEVKYEWVEKKCLVSSCNASTTSKNGYCKFHNIRLRAGIPLDLPRQIGGGGRGERNHRWNGGTSDYPNHYELKKNRLIKLKSVNYLCEFCGEKARYVHHLDGSKNNHAIKNLIAVCAKCHFSNFHEKSHASKYKKFYGYTRKELSAMGFFKIGSKYKRLYGLTSKELIKAGIYDEVRVIHKKLKQFKSTTLQAA